MSLEQLQNDDTQLNDVFSDIVKDENIKSQKTMTKRKTEEDCYDKIWNKEMVQYSQILKTKDILPVLKQLVASLD